MVRIGIAKKQHSKIDDLRGNAGKNHILGNARSSSAFSHLRCRCEICTTRMLVYTKSAGQRVPGPKGGRSLGVANNSPSVAGPEKKSREQGGRARDKGPSSTTLNLKQEDVEGAIDTTYTRCARSAAITSCQLQNPSRPRMYRSNHCCNRLVLRNGVHQDKG